MWKSWHQCQNSGPGAILTNECDAKIQTYKEDKISMEKIEKGTGACLDHRCYSYKTVTKLTEDPYTTKKISNTHAFHVSLLQKITNLNEKIKEFGEKYNKILRDLWEDSDEYELWTTDDGRMNDIYEVVKRLTNVLSILNRFLDPILGGFEDSAAEWVKENVDYDVALEIEKLMVSIYENANKITLSNLRHYKFKYIFSEPDYKETEKEFLKETLKYYKNVAWTKLGHEVGILSWFRNHVDSKSYYKKSHPNEENASVFLQKWKSIHVRIIGNKGLEKKSVLILQKDLQRLMDEVSFHKEIFKGHLNEYDEYDSDNDDDDIVEEEEYDKLEKFITKSLRETHKFIQRNKYF